MSTSTIKKILTIDTQSAYWNESGYPILDNGLVPYYSGSPIKLVLDLSSQVSQEKEAYTIRTDNPELLGKYKACLGDLCNVAISSPNHKSNVLMGPDEFFSPPNLKKENLANVARNFSEVLREIPAHFSFLKNSPLALTDKHTFPLRMGNKLVHKNIADNVLISAPFRTGNMYWFNMFENSPEFNFDHPSDHIQGMLLMEGLRQASTASVHLAGLPMKGSIALLSFDINFSNYLNSGYPILIRSFAHLSTCGHDGKECLTMVVSQVFQMGKMCAEAILTGQTFWSQDDYIALRTRTKNIVERQKKVFEKIL